ncbi:Protein of unknown function [Gryllus bimaculatus]|nr:Protein of unknown function [Gryllus bimaculatus]
MTAQGGVVGGGGAWRKAPSRHAAAHAPGGVGTPRMLRNGQLNYRKTLPRPGSSSASSSAVPLTSTRQHTTTTALAG